MQNRETKCRLIEKLKREMGSPMLAAIEDPEIIEILLNPNGELWVERLGRSMTKLDCINPVQAESLIATVASYVGRVIDIRTPILECEFPLDGSRFEALQAPIVEGPTFSLRKRVLRALNLENYIDEKIITVDQADIVCASIKQRKNILVIGGTGSGKTTFANALIDSMVTQCPDHRLVIIEDTREIQCVADNAVALKTSDFVDMTGLLKATLRLRPDRIIVGEVRGGEALALLKAWNTGHPGGIATLHANNAKAGLLRLEQLIGEVSQTPMQKLIAEAINLLVVISKVAGSRKITEIAEVEGYSGDKYILRSR